MCVYQVLGKQVHLFLTTVYVLGILSVNLHVGTKLTVEPKTANWRSSLIPRLSFPKGASWQGHSEDPIM